MKDVENVPMKENIEDYFEREVAHLCQMLGTKTKMQELGYEIPFNKYFYDLLLALRSLEDISTDIFKLEEETDGLLKRDC